MTQWWSLAIPAATGVIGAILGGLTQGWNSRRLYAMEAEERRRARFAEERRIVYVRFLLALSEWEPLRTEAWRLREQIESSDDRVSAERAWREARVGSEPSFQRLVTANQEIQIIAPKPAREAATRLFIEAARTTAIMQFREELMTAIRIDLGTDADLAAAGSALLAGDADHLTTEA